MKRRCVWIFLWSLIWGVISVMPQQSPSSTVWADNVFGLTGNQRYDIYVRGGAYGLTVIRYVDIIGWRDIQGDVFLVIQSDTFAAQRSEGVIRYEDIVAVLPSEKSRGIENIEQIRSYRTKKTP